jgi:hypothetical protein
MLEISSTESRVTQMLLAGDHPTLETLRRQFDQARVSERDMTGVGFFTSFEVHSDNVLRVEPSGRWVIGDVCADVDEVKYGCGFKLFVDNGVIGTLECHLWGDDRMPLNPQFTRLYYVHQPNPPGIAETKERDMEFVKAMLLDVSTRKVSK